MLIVIAGAGEVGYSLANDLSADYDVIVIEKDERKIDELRGLDIDVIKGNAANPDSLKKARVNEAEIFIGVTGNSEVNILSGILAKKLGANKVIARVSNPEYVDKPVIRGHPLGIDLVICPQLALAGAIANLVTIPSAIDFVSFSGGKIDMIEVMIPNDSPLIEKRISELNLPDNVIITAIYRNDEIIVPRGDTKLKAGDKIAVVGKSEDLSKISDILGKRVIKNVVIFGGGTVGSYVAKILDRSNLNLKLIDVNPAVCENLCKILKRTRVIIGDATDLDFLMEEEIGKSDVVIATTESDGKNLLIALLSKSLGAKKAIVKVEKGSYIKLFEKVGVDVALSPKEIAHLEILKHLKLMKLRAPTKFEKKEIAVLEILVEKDKLSGKRIKDMKLPKGTIIGCILREDQCLIPKGETEIRLGDKLLIFTTWDNVEKVESKFT